MRDAETVMVLEADPDLGVVVPAPQLDAARRRSVAVVETLPAGAWAYAPPSDPIAFGLLVLDGLVGARVVVGEHAHIEVLGEGDLLRPWAHIGPEASVPSSVDWRVLDRTRVALLDGGFARAMAPWPQIPASLMHRLVLRVRRLSFQLAVTAVRGVDERLHIVLWHFADRWGRMTPEGVSLRLALTHADLGMIVSASRPTVTTALGDLRREGLVEWDLDRRTWLLTGSPPTALREIKERVGLPV